MRKREYLHWIPQKGGRVNVYAYRWWAKAKAGEFDDLYLTPRQIPASRGEGTVVRRLPAWEIADYEVLVDGDGPEIMRRFCYHYDELHRV